jgi:hypothetical protein
MRVAWIAASLAFAGCGKELNPEFCAAHANDERCTAAPDARPIDAGSTFPVEHLTPATEAMLTSDVDISVDTTGTVIDTSAGTITPGWTGAVILANVAQEDGPSVMVVQVGSFTVAASADTIDVNGSRPLIIVAARTITVDGRINVSADGSAPGPGGFAAGLGPGSGLAGQAANATGNGGGGGGAFGYAGGRGGNPAGGEAGAAYGAASRLEGGSGGGLPSVPMTGCVVTAGAGGGALQLTALGSITIAGNINAGGSGGQGGEYCNTNGSGGGGGGAGGMIFLEAPMLLGSGNLGALGGGGGEAANSFGAAGIDGTDAGTTTPGTGGVSTNSGGDGGSGATDGTVGAQGMDASSGDGNGGGGAGGGGRIYYRTPADPSYSARPAASRM